VGVFAQSPVGSERGFTLIELMLSIIILVVGLLGLATAMASMTRLQDLAQARAEMTLLADAKMEDLRGRAAARPPDSSLIAIGGSLATPTALHVDTVSGRGGRVYLRLWSVVAGAGGTRDVTLRVRPLVDDVRTPARLDFSTQIIIAD
jgi:prepilin-type N-terminal cleavage/methylation domain-containing protein